MFSLAAWKSITEILYPEVSLSTISANVRVQWAIAQISSFSEVLNTSLKSGKGTLWENAILMAVDPSYSAGSVIKFFPVIRKKAFLKFLILVY